ncbi:helix-turn-helix domain-containing protein [Azospirillum picis]|uniref:AraC-like DNA-binding protein n=1 Tax=Azospirillum picis TaxID=488438 RepID=A0ABU0MSY4_9PROT|nr:helix-turn-helix domain-containing protein [Azospirillum picis]MBP2302766.1 AraC-like DNA-binding protein [Azospirillum picis]MDQ0536572.1 AraC-like DNA-binding protein [Azospirillum picis]
MATQTVPFRRFSTSFLPENERFGAWREAMTTVYEIPTMGQEARRRFSGTATSAHLGPLIVGTMDVDALSYHRSPGKIRSDHMDHFIVRLDSAGVAGNPADEILVKDMGQPINLPPMRLDGACIIIPRDIMTGMLPRADALHGTRPGGVMGRLLADHMRSLAGAVQSATTGEAPQVARAIRDMVAACLAPSHDALVQARPQIAATLMMQARRYIDANLTDPCLSADRLCLALGLSRSALYTLFEPHQGVARYILGRRLLRVRECLSDAADPRRIGEIAFSFGFGSEAHFSRAFRRAFGCTPSEARAGAYGARLAGAGGTAAGDAGTDGGIDGGFPDWLRRLRA